jgi:hypothetical protein
MMEWRSYLYCCGRKGETVLQVNYGTNLKVVLLQPKIASGLSLAGSADLMRLVVLRTTLPYLTCAPRIELNDCAYMPS